MSTAKPKRTPGIEQRTAKDGTVSFRATVFDKRTGKRTNRTFPNLTAAKRWREDATVALRRGEFRVEQSPRVAEALADLLDGMSTGRVLNRSGERYRPGTVRTYGYAIRDVLAPKLGHLRLHEVRRRDVQRVANEMRETNASASKITNTIDPLRVVFRRAIREDLITTSPCDHLELPAVRPQRKTALDPAAVTTLIDALPDDLAPLYATAFYAGLRRGELRALRWDHLDLDRAVIYVRESWDDVEGAQEPKSAAGVRDVLILPMLRTLLAGHGLRTGRTGNDLVFGRTAGEPFAKQTVGRRAKLAWEAAGLEPTTLHRARHCAASFLVASGLDVTTVREYLGHADSRITLELYSHAIPDRHRLAAERVEEFLRGVVEG